MKQIPTQRFILEDGVFIIQDKTGRNADIVYENVQDLCEITDLKWLGVKDDSEDHIANLACNNYKIKKSYIESDVHEVCCAVCLEHLALDFLHFCTVDFVNNRF